MEFQFKAGVGKKQEAVAYGNILNLQNPWRAGLFYKSMM